MGGNEAEIFIISILEGKKKFLLHETSAQFVSCTKILKIANSESMTKRKRSSENLVIKERIFYKKFNRENFLKDVLKKGENLLISPLTAWWPCFPFVF